MYDTRPAAPVSRAPTVSARTTAIAFGALAAHACAHFGWSFQRGDASVFDLLFRLPATLLYGLPLYAIAGVLFARGLKRRIVLAPWGLDLGHLPVYAILAMACAGLRWFVMATALFARASRGEPSPIGALDALLLLPQIGFSTLLAFAAAALPARRLERAAREGAGRLPASVAAPWILAAYGAILATTFVFEAGAGALIPAGASR